MEELYLLTKEQIKAIIKDSYMRNKMSNPELPEPIKVPTDEEIDKFAFTEYYHTDSLISDISKGMKFMRDQFLKQVKK